MTAAVAVRERPVLMSGPMVRAILDGRKSQTRRVVMLPKWIAKRGGSLDEAWVDPGLGGGAYLKVPLHDDATSHRVRSPYGEIGDQLWVRETFGHDWYDDGQSRAWKRLIYRADDPSAQPQDQLSAQPWRPSIFMPRALSRITLEITNVRVERVQSITWADAKAEGMGMLDDENREQWASVAPPGETNWGTYQEIFANLWDSLNASRGYSWESNPLVWVLEFKRVAV